MHVVAVHQLVVNVAVAEVDGVMARTVTSAVRMPMASMEVMVAEALGMVL
jgi:lambda repressor-like predicted transcriptional regulator